MQCSKETSGGRSESKARRGAIRLLKRQHSGRSCLLWPPIGIMAARGSKPTEAVGIHIGLDEHPKHAQSTSLWPAPCRRAEQTRRNNTTSPPRPPLHHLEAVIVHLQAPDRDNVGEVGQNSRRVHRAVIAGFHQLHHPVSRRKPAGVGGEAAAAMLRGRPHPCPRCRCRHLRRPSLSLTRSRQLPLPAKP